MVTRIAMFAASGCYLIATFAYLFEGKPWMAATMFCFLTSNLCMFMAGGF